MLKWVVVVVLVVFGAKKIVDYDSLMQEKGASDFGKAYYMRAMIMALVAVVVFVLECF